MADCSNDLEGSQTIQNSLEFKRKYSLMKNRAFITLLSVVKLLEKHHQGVWEERKEPECQ
jgi:hypothetical protein